MISPLLKVGDVAAILNLKPSTVYALDIPSYKIGASRRWSREDVEDYVKERAKRPRSPQKARLQWLEV